MARKKAKVTPQNELTVSPFALDAVQVEELRRKLAKRANQRLVRLERKKASTGESLAELGVAQYAYEQIRKVRSLSGTGKLPTSGKLRFREQKLPWTDTEARMELMVLQSFLGQETSKAGVAASYVSKTEQILTERYAAAGGRSRSIASYKSFYNFLNSAAFAYLKDAGLNSNEIIDKYNKAFTEKKQSFKAMDKAIADYIAETEQRPQGKPTLKGLAESLGVSVL